MRFMIFHEIHVIKTENGIIDTETVRMPRRYVHQLLPIAIGQKADGRIGQKKLSRIVFFMFFQQPLQCLRKSFLDNFIIYIHAFSLFANRIPRRKSNHRIASQGILLRRIQKYRPLLICHFGKNVHHRRIAMKCSKAHAVPSTVLPTKENSLKFHVPLR